MAKKLKPKVVRVPVKYDYAAIHPGFLKMLAEIGAYADEKYGSWALYLDARLTGNADPINHIYEHLREYRLRVPYDHFEGDVRRHLAAIAYNAMMAFAAECKWGPLTSPYGVESDERPWPPVEAFFVETPKAAGLGSPKTNQEGLGDLVSSILSCKACPTYNMPIIEQVRWTLGGPSQSPTGKKKKKKRS